MAKLERGVWPIGRWSTFTKGPGNLLTSYERLQITNNTAIKHIKRTGTGFTNETCLQKRIGLGQPAVDR